MDLYFAQAALNDAMQTNENQIFLSASTLDSERIRNHVIDLAKSQELSLSGNPLVLPNGAMLSFLQTDSQVSGGYSGNAYVMNCFDETSYSYINELVSAWTMLKKHKAAFVSID
ncbi:terminase large subunit domain-containing protein [Vibrio sp. Vb339]|uniref:terminase large subunit domain-containing protein n=1 Tax=Vibrio sp. Vb339 TaxID=1192013 RepID=UPI001556E5A1|nr:terminase family protein [Vibrio sp. Vb339]